MFSYVLEKLDRLEEELQEERRKRKVLKQRVHELEMFTGVDPHADLTSDLAGHVLTLAGRVGNLEQHTDVRYDDLSDEEKRALDEQYGW